MVEAHYELIGKGLTIHSIGRRWSKLVSTLILMGMLASLIRFYETQNLNLDILKLQVARYFPSLNKEVNPAEPLLLRSILPGRSLSSMAFWEQERNNPLETHLKLVIDDQLSIESLPTSFTVNINHSIVIQCAHENITLHCPPAYRVWFVGPTVYSPLYAQSSEVLDERRVRINFMIQDPGFYSIYAFPEHEHCDQWNDESKPQFHRMSVRGSPLSVEFTGESPVDGSSICPQAVPGTDVGRWISRDYINPVHLQPSSPHWWWLHNRFLELATEASSYRYFYVPYACKKPHHGFREWIEILKPKHLLIFGDSVLRDMFCMHIWPGLLGQYKEVQCTSTSDIKVYHESNKNITFNHEDGQQSELSFVWIPNGNAETLTARIESDIARNRAPSHVFFGLSLHLALTPSIFYVNRMRQVLEVFENLLPNAHVVARTSGGVVQAIRCTDRIGGQRAQMERMGDDLITVTENFTTVTPFDVYPIFNDRPDASSDGRHWSGNSWNRPEVGSVEYALADEIFYSWLK